MLTKNVVALKRFNLNTGLEQVSFEKGDEKRIKFRSESNYNTLLSFGNFREKHNGEPVVKKEKIEVVKKETVVIENSSVTSSPDSVSNNVDTFTEIGQICSNCGTDMKLSGESNDVKEHVYDFVCPICKTEKEVRVGNLLESKEDTEAIEEEKEEFRELEVKKEDPYICPICGRRKRRNSKYCKGCQN